MLKTTISLIKHMILVYLQMNEDTQQFLFPTIINSTFFVFLFTSKMI